MSNDWRLMAVLLCADCVQYVSGLKQPQNYICLRIDKFIQEAQPTSKKKERNYLNSLIVFKEK